MPELAGVVEAGRRLPGGLSPWRGRWLVLRWPAARDAVVTSILAPLVLVLLPLGTYLAYGPWVGSAVLVATLVLAVINALPFVAPGVLVTPRSQPELGRLVGEVAAQVSVRPPARVRLTHDGAIRARVFMLRRELLVGEALLLCLSRAEAAALVAHELTTMDHRRPGLVHRLVSIWGEALIAARDDISEYVPMDRVGRRLAAKRRIAQRLVVEIAPLAAAVHRRADAAASVSGGSAETAASAFAQALAVYLEFGGFPFQGPGGRPRKVPALTDLIDGWRRCVEHGVELSATGPGWEPTCVDRLGSEHPDLLAALRSMATTEIVPRLAADSVALMPLTPAQSRRPEPRRRGPWTTFAEVPPRVWLERAARDARALRRRAAVWLDRDAADDLEVATAVLAWEVDEDEAGAVPGVVRGSDPVRSAPPGVGYLVEDRLLPDGFRLEHPAVRGVLLAPDGRRVNARELVTGTYLAPDLSELRALLAIHRIEPPMPPGRV